MMPRLIACPDIAPHSTPEMPNRRKKKNKKNKVTINMHEDSIIVRTPTAEQANEYNAQKMHNVPTLLKNVKMMVAHF